MIVSQYRAVTGWGGILDNLFSTGGKQYSPDALESAIQDIRHTAALQLATANANNDSAAFDALGQIAEDADQVERRLQDAISTAHEQSTIFSTVQPDQTALAQIAGQLDSLNRRLNQFTVHAVGPIQGPGQEQTPSPLSDAADILKWGVIAVVVIGVMSMLPKGRY